MAFSNTAPLSYAQGDVVKYVNAQRGVSDDVGGPALTVIGLFNPNNSDVFDPSIGANTATSTRITANTTSQQIAAANTNRKGMYLVNELGSNTTILVKFGSAPANTTAYTFPIYPGGIYELGSIRFTGNVHIVTASGSSNVISTELSA